MDNVVYFIFNNKNSYYDFKIKIIDKVIIPFPKAKKNTISIPGGEDLIEDEGGYEDIKIPVSITILDKNEVKNKYREIIRWLSIIKDNHLIFSNDPEYFYKVKDIDLDNFETKFSLFGEAKIDFICSPNSFEVDGLNEIQIPANLFNNGLSAKPTYILRGEGIISLIINGNEVEFNVGQELIVDVERELIFKQGSIHNEVKKGAWEHLKLTEGENDINYKFKPGSRVDEILIIPNWRTI